MIYGAATRSSRTCSQWWFPVYYCFDELDDAVVILNRDNTVARLNRSFQETFGIEGEAAHGMEIGEFINRCLSPFIPEEERTCRVLDALRHRREVSHVACRMRTRAGEVRWFSFSCRAMASVSSRGGKKSTSGLARHAAASLQGLMVRSTGAMGVFFPFGEPDKRPRLEDRS